MGYINQPPQLQSMFADLEQRLRKLETAARFTAPSVVTDPTYPRVGDIVYNTTSDFLKYWNGTDWIEIADNLYSTTVNAIPTTMQSANNNMVYTGNPVLIEVQRIGKMITANALIDFTNVTNFGTGQYYFDLPGSIPARAHDLVASGFVEDNGTVYTCFGTLAANDNKMYLFVPTSNGGSADLDYNTPAVLDTTSVINITGVALLA